MDERMAALHQKPFVGLSIKVSGFSVFFTFHSK